MIDSKKLLADLQSKTGSRTTMVKRLEDDLRARCDADPAVDAPLLAQYADAIAKKRTALTYKAWREEELTQVAVAWVLGCVFVRFLEDNELVETPKLSGPGARLQRARDEHEVFFRSLPQDNTDRGYLIEIFEEVGKLPGMREFFDKKHNPLWLAAPSGDACRELLQFWQKTNPATGALLHDFTDPDWNTRFLGDLYQDLSEAARKKYALLQTPDFVESFILDRTLTPAIETFGYRVVRLIDFTCGSGHFLLGTFARMFRIWQDECPGENPRVLAQRALDGVFGVDLNPFAVAIARFRLLLAALQVSGVRQLKDAPDFQIHVAAGDSLLHGRRFRESESFTAGTQRTFDTGEEVFRDELKHHYEVEDGEALHRILGQQYHAVVGNPPYINVKDRAVSELYRARFPSCHGRYALSVPFMERFFDLAVKGDGTPQQPAGYVGQITSNSFMKREFGKKLIEEYLPRWDLTHVLDTSGAYIPGHGTPTVILFGKNQPPVSGNIRTVLGIRGEPSSPDEPEMGVVWQSILKQVDQPGSVSEWVNAADSPRANFHRHPWSIGGGGAAELKELIDEAGESPLRALIDVIGVFGMTNCDEVFVGPAEYFRRSHLPSLFSRLFITGEQVRDWSIEPADAAFFPYDGDQLAPLSRFGEFNNRLWTFRSVLGNRATFAKLTYFQEGRPWWEWHQVCLERLSPARTIAFPFVATHNQFVLEAGAAVFNRHAPIIKLPAAADDALYFRLLAVLNSSVACFWMKQVFHNKGDSTDQRGARTTGDVAFNTYEFGSTQVASFPIPARQPTQLPNALVQASTAQQGQSPAATLASWGGPASGGLRPLLASARLGWSAQRQFNIAWQEELDWQIYEAFGLIALTDQVSQPEGVAMDAIPPDGIRLGQRAFEIVLARRMAAGEVQTTWFARHGSTPITEVPSHWPAAYRELVERRITRIESDSNLRLIEQPEYKRRWNTESWEKSQQEALRQWLLARLEGYFHEGSRVCDLAEPDGRKTFDPAAHGFTAAARPHLVSANQLADVVQSDTRFLEAAEVYVGAAGFSVPKLVRELVESESVPTLPRDRYKDSGLRKRQDWEETWRLQRLEDAVEEEVRSQGSGVNEEELKKRIRKAQLEKVGDIPVPPKYGSTDFKKASHWKLRGKLDVPKERWISYPGAERAGDDSPLIAWAGWDHLQQAQALAEYFIDAQTNQGWPPARLKPLLAGLADLIPWLKQWHNTHDPAYGMGLGDYFASFLEEQCRALGMTVQEVDAVRFEAEAETGRATTRKAAGTKKAGRKGKAAGSETDAVGHWQDQEFRLLAPKRKALTDYRMLVWPEILRQMPGEMEFETFRKAYWLLSEPEQLAKLGRETFADIPAAWWRSRTEQLAKEDFLTTLKGSVQLGDMKIWKQDDVRMVQWRGDGESGDFPEAVDDARIALQLASLWIEEEADAVQATLEPELVLLETR
jgi:hypothetical protein